MGVNDSGRVTQKGDHGAEILAHFSTVQLGASCHGQQQAPAGPGATLYSGGKQQKPRLSPAPGLQAECSLWPTPQAVISEEGSLSNLHYDCLPAKPCP